MDVGGREGGGGVFDEIARGKGVNVSLGVKCFQ